MTTDNNELKRKIIDTIGAAIDEASVIGVENSFIEMDQAVLHYAGEGVDRYFRITLTETTELEYWQPYDPTK